MPIRVQRKRTKGFRLPPNTVYVGRPSKWGNPYKIGKDGLLTVEAVLDAYEKWVRQEIHECDSHFLDPLIGKDLACWCPLDKPCHTDVLLKILETPYYSVKNKCVLIGGYPKGHYRPFDIRTRSGSRLRAIVSEIGLNAVYIDLWQTEQEEKKGKIEPFVLSVIRCHISQSVNCVALGKWVWKCLHKAGVDILCLPHPGSRRASDLAKLEEGLRKLSV